MTKSDLPPYLAFDPATRRLRLDPHEPALLPEPVRSLCLAAWRIRPAFFWEEFGFWCFGGFDDVNRLLRDRRFGRQSPTGVPDSRGVGMDRSHLAAFDGIEANSMLELEPPVHTQAAHTGQPRLRLAAGRTAEAPRRSARQRADRPLRTGQGRSAAGLRLAACRSPSSPKCSACRSRWGRNCSTGRTRWWPCTCTAAHARPRRRPTARRAIFPISCAAMSPSGASSPATICCRC